MISLIMPAHNAQNFIIDSIESIRSQTLFNKNSSSPEYELLIGVDGCRNTLEKIKELINKNMAVSLMPLRVFWFEKNCGHFIVRNTLVDASVYDYIMFFDADDIMMPMYAEVMFSKKDKYDIIRSRQRRFGNFQGTQKSHSQIGLYKSTFNKLGGYFGWYCAADSDFLNRASIAGYSIGVTGSEPIMYRRGWEGALTQRADTGRSSKLRAQYCFIRDKNKKEKIKYADYPTTECKEMIEWE
jgi:glycosyltransferase involved in cell wall biosynthesis